MLEIGNKAPDFSLQNQSDETISLKDYSGKWLVVYFYPKDNTSGCTKEACDFTEKYNEFTELDCDVVGVSPDSVSSHQNFISKQSLGITLLSDPDKSMIKEYGAWGLKKNYGKEYEGLIRSTFIVSPTGKIAAIWKNVKVHQKRKDGILKHVDVVKEKLEELRK
ncbi:MAG: thioredoxin-dependent thiol peroxidase [Saprospiraceae bacterium]|nr:thioredoxin-dependent thiol peroxidase [Saprospiraceae bacterium]